MGMKGVVVEVPDTLQRVESGWQENGNNGFGRFIPDWKSRDSEKLLAAVPVALCKPACSH